MRATSLFVFASAMSLTLICEARGTLGAASRASASLLGTESPGADASLTSVVAADLATALAEPLKSGGRTEDAAFSVWLEGPAEVVVGEASKAQARVVAKEPYKCNEKYPAKFTWDAQDGFSTGAAKVTGMNVAGKEGTLALPFSAARSGPLTLSGTLSFSVCTKENCRIEKRKLQLSIEAKPRG